MANFCNACGATLSGPFCVKCGADMRQFSAAAQSPAPPVPPPIRVQPPTPPTPAPAVSPISVPVAAPNATPAKGSPVIKIVVAVFAVLFVFGVLAVAGVWYAAHRVSQKIHEVSAEITGSSPTSDGDSSSAGSRSNSVVASGSSADVCRFLSKEDVSRAIGVEIIRTESTEDNCSYIAKGNQADMTARHSTAIVASRGADQQTQKMLQGFAGTMFKNFQNENPEGHKDTGEVPVLMFSIDENSADTQMQLNNKVLGILGPTGAVNISGIGDQAFASGDSIMMVRKGNKLIRIMYMTCPCATDAVKPLAKKLADAL